MYALVCAHVYLYVYYLSNVKAWKWCQFSSSIVLYFAEAGFLAELRAHQFQLVQLARLLQGSGLWLVSAGITGKAPPLSSFYLGSGNLNDSPVLSKEKLYPQTIYAAHKRYHF